MRAGDRVGVEDIAGLQDQLLVHLVLRAEAEAPDVVPVFDGGAGGDAEEGRAVEIHRQLVIGAPACVGGDSTDVPLVDARVVQAGGVAGRQGDVALGTDAVGAYRGVALDLLLDLGAVDQAQGQVAGQLEGERDGAAEADRVALDLQQGRNVREGALQRDVEIHDLQAGGERHAVAQLEGGRGRHVEGRDQRLDAVVASGPVRVMLDAEPVGGIEAEAEPEPVVHLLRIVGEGRREPLVVRSIPFFPRGGRYVDVHGRIDQGEAGVERRSRQIRHAGGVVVDRLGARGCAQGGPSERDAARTGLVEREAGRQSAAGPEHDRQGKQVPGRVSRVPDLHG